MKTKFYRSQLATIVWDSQNDCILADFKQGYFLTSDKREIEILKDLGYPEVEVESKKPPENLIVKQPSIELKGDVPLLSSNLSEKLAEKRFAQVTNQKEVKPPSRKEKKKKPKIKRPKDFQL